MPNFWRTDTSWVHKVPWFPLSLLIFGQNFWFLVPRQLVRQKVGIHISTLTYTLCFISLRSLACLWSKMPMFQRAGMKEGGLSFPPAFQYLILMIWRANDLNLVMISSLASKCQDFKLRGLQFHFIKRLKNEHPNFLRKMAIFPYFM